jgi:surface antigen
VVSRAMGRAALCVLLCATLGGCVSGGPKQSFGTLGGAVGGGLAGAQFGSGSGRLIATGVGSYLGALFGGDIGRSLDRADTVYADRSGPRYARGQAYRQPRVRGGACRLVDDSGYDAVYACQDGRGGWYLSQ